MRISVALAAYNGEKFIVSQLRSLAEQTVLPDEVIICDDCSTDRTVSLVNDFIAENGLGWQVYINKENLGFTDNFRRALSLCTGEIVFLCDQDDVWEKDKIRAVADVFSRRDNVQAVFSSFLKIDENGDLIRDGKAPKGANNGLIPFAADGELTVIGLDTLLCANVSPGCTAAFSKQTVDCYLESGSADMPHDWELGILAAKYGEAVYLDRKLIRYRIHGGNAIGLSDPSSGGLKMHGSDKKRVEVLLCRMRQAGYIAGSGLSGDCFKTFIKYTANREKAVLKGSAFAAFRNLFLYPRLKGKFCTAFREVPGDVIFALKHRNGVNCHDK